MILKSVRSVHNNDFVGTYECEWCGGEREVMCYDDLNFHTNVVPRLECPACQWSTLSATKCLLVAARRSAIPRHPSIKAKKEAQ